MEKETKVRYSDLVKEKTRLTAAESYFDSLDETVIKNAARPTKGAAGLSHMDSEQYRHILVGRKFKKEGEDLREQIALLAKKLQQKL